MFTKEEILEKIKWMEATIDLERYNKKQGGTFDEGFDCGTQLALDLLVEWREALDV